MLTNYPIDPTASNMLAFFYRLRNAAHETLYMLYYTLVYSKMQYGIIVWATANKVKLNKILRIVLFCSKFTPISNFYKTLNYLQLEDITDRQADKFISYDSVLINNAHKTIIVKIIIIKKMSAFN